MRNGLGWQCVAESCPQEGRSVAEPAAGGSGAPCGGNAGCRGKRQVEAGLGRPPVLTTCETVCTRNAGDLAWPIRCAPACLAPSASLLRPQLDLPSDTPTHDAPHTMHAGKANPELLLHPRPRQRGLYLRRPLDAVRIGARAAHDSASGHNFELLQMCNGW